MNLFISYSHVDESHKDRLNTHLSTLKRNNVINAWTDNMIMPGQEWGEEINRNLEESEIILLLISPDFIASDYCYEKEMGRAIEKHSTKEAVVVPIIIEPCDWVDTPFSKLQALPKDAKAISLWGNHNEAWQNVIANLKKTITTVKDSKIDRAIIQDTIWSSVISYDFDIWLNDTEIELKHRKVDKVKLDDIFVTPDVKSLDEKIDVSQKAVNSRDLLIREVHLLIFGDEQSGKTSLAKYYFKELIKLEQWPVLVRGSEIKSADISKLLELKISDQYSKEFNYNECRYKTIIIDNFPNIKLNKKFQNKLIENIKNKFDKIIILSIDSFQYVVPEIEELDGFSHFELLSFGNVKRTELVEKWVSMGSIEEIDEVDLYSEIDEIKINIESITRGNILPPKPIYLLSLIQMFESTTPHKVELTSYGHCYQYLIYQALETARIRNSDIDKYINFLTEFGCAQFNNDGEGLSPAQLDSFNNEYEKKFISIGKDKVINDLVGSGILIEKNDLILFKYSYIYYFFTAKKLAESFSNDDEAKINIKGLLENLHREDCANIIIFITHHSKDDWVLDEIQICLMDLFSEYEEANLESNSLDFMTDFMNEIPDLVLEHRKVDEERTKHDTTLDTIEEETKKLQKAQDEMEPNDILAQINRVFKGVEIIGQIIRNRHGSLNKQTLEDLAEQAYGVGLRFLQYFLNLTDSSKDEVVQLIEHNLKENPSITNEKLEKEAKNIFMLLTYGAIYGVLKKISISIGSREAEEIYKRIEESSPSPATKLINQSINLQFNKNMDIKSIKTLADEFRKNPTCERLLKEIIIQHIYMFPVKYKHKQQIAEILNIPIENQILLGKQKSFKI